MGLLMFLAAATARRRWNEPIALRFVFCHLGSEACNTTLHRDASEAGGTCRSPGCRPHSRSSTGIRHAHAAATNTSMISANGRHIYKNKAVYNYGCYKPHICIS
eukprot:5311062-Pleurochrysis_carterae.AAC.1